LRSLRRPPETFDATTAVQKALSAILRTGEWFRRGPPDRHPDRNGDRQGARSAGHDRLPTFGVGTEFDRKGWQAVFRQMMGHDLVRPDPARHGALRMTEAARPDPAGEAGSRCARHAGQGPRPPPGQGAGVGGGRAAAVGAQGQAPRAGRGARVPAYVIFTDRTLIEMAEPGRKASTRWRASPAWAQEARALRRRLPRGHHRRGGGPGASRAPQARRAGGRRDLRPALSVQADLAR
jgi:superfamily II DNA helicase RecQ